MAIGEIRVYKTVVKGEKSFSWQRVPGLTNDTNTLRDFVSDMIDVSVPF